MNQPVGSSENPGHVGCSVLSPAFGGFFLKECAALVFLEILTWVCSILIMCVFK